MSDLNEPNTSPEHLLAEVVASHFINARVAEQDGDQVVVLGEGLPTIECHINSMQEVLPHGTFIMLIIRGGALGPHGATVTASGYGENMHHALVAAAAVWLAAGGCLGWPHAVVWVALAVRSLVMPLRQWKLAGEKRPMPPRTLGRTEMLFTAAFLITIAL